MTMPRRPDQSSRPVNVPLSPSGVTVAQMIEQGLLTNADMVALGLMRDATGQTMLNAGVPPGVPAITSVSQTFGTPGGSPYTLFTFPSAGRLWAVSLSAAVATDSSYSTGLAQFYALVSCGGVELEVVELAVGDASQAVNDHGDLPLNGLPAASSAAIVLDVNNMNEPSGSVVRASCNVLYSVP